MIIFVMNRMFQLSVQSHRSAPVVIKAGKAHLCVCLCITNLSYFKLCLAVGMQFIMRTLF